MSKYITHFQTEAAYQAALPSLDLPNVSLVDELGEVHYHRALYGAHAGDICLYDVAEAQKIVVTAEDWNLTSYPTASYPIIGIVAFEESAVGLTVMSNFGVAADGSKTTSNVGLKWQNTSSISWGTTTYSTADDAKADLNGKSNTTAIINAIKAYDTSHSTDNITGCVGGAIQAFVTDGTVTGDWYICSFGELYNTYENKTAIMTAADKIYNANNTLGMSGNTLFSISWSSSAGTLSGRAWYYGLNNGVTGQYDKTSEYMNVRAFLRV